MNNQYYPEFADGTKNAAIFKTNAPYANIYQGLEDRWLFVCSAGLLRSPTGATMAAAHNINARSCGSNFQYALIPCSANLICWADKIIFVNPTNYDELIYEFAKYPDLVTKIKEKAVVLDIPDIYDYMESSLQDEFNKQLFSNM